MKRITDSLVSVSSPINHGKVKWDRKETQDFIGIVKALGNQFMINNTNVTVLYFR